MITLVSPSISLLTGEFGVVYKAQMAERGTYPAFKIVAVKTLKG